MFSASIEAFILRKGRPLLKSFGIAILLALGAGSFVVPASATPIVNVTACDTLSLDPLRVRTTFELSSFGGARYDWLVIHPRPTGPAPEDSTHFYDCGSPPGWNCYRYDGEPYLNFEADQTWGGDRVAGFWIVSNQSVPCAHMIFGNPVIGDEYFIQACLRCDGPLPAQRASWGSVKSRYR
jgi:hypothetical protein